MLLIAGQDGATLGSPPSLDSVAFDLLDGPVRSRRLIAPNFPSRPCLAAGEQLDLRQVEGALPEFADAAAAKFQIPEREGTPLAKLAGVPSSARAGWPCSSVKFWEP